MLGQGCFDFSRFDAVAANFDLVVKAPYELDVSVWQIARQISSLIQAIAKSVGEGVGNELFASEVRAIEVTASQGRRLRCAVHRPHQSVPAPIAYPECKLACWRLGGRWE